MLTSLAVQPLGPRPSGAPAGMSMMPVVFPSAIGQGCPAETNDAWRVRRSMIPVHSVT